LKRESKQTPRRTIKRTNTIEVLARINLFYYKDSCMSILVREVQKIKAILLVSTIAC